MYLSDEQMNCVTSPGIGAWEPIALPTGRQALPGWVAGAVIDWMNGAGNAPEVKLKVRGKVRDWPNAKWTHQKGGALYMTQHEDGRARALYHGGGVTMSAAWRIFTGDEPYTYRWKVPDRLQPGETDEQAAQREAQAHLATIMAHVGDAEETMHPSGTKMIRADSLHAVVKTLNVTAQQDGFGGDGYLLQMVDGSEYLLRGPWHGGAPAGFVEVTLYDMTQEPNPWEVKKRRHRPWNKRSGSGSLYIREDLFLRIVSTYLPHVGLARVQHSYGPRMEPYRLEWDEVKATVYELERARASRHEPAGPFWKVYWDRSERYCGSPCPDTPPYGLL